MFLLWKWKFFKMSQRKSLSFPLFAQKRNIVSFIRTKTPKWNTQKRKYDWLFHWNDVCCCDFSIYWKSNFWFVVQFATLFVFRNPSMDSSIWSCVGVFVFVSYLIHKFNPLVCHCCCCRCRCCALCFVPRFLFHSNIFHMIPLAFVQFVNWIVFKVH